MYSAAAWTELSGKLWQILYMHNYYSVYLMCVFT